MFQLKFRYFKKITVTFLVKVNIRERNAYIYFQLIFQFLWKLIVHFVLIIISVH